MLQKVILPPLTATQVEVEILMCGLCHTDCHCRDNDWGGGDFPLLAGHEGLGIVRKKGSKVSSLDIGARVAIGWLRDSCTDCKACIDGRENVCEVGYQGLFLGASSGMWGKSPLGYNTMGGCFARVQRIEERFATPIPENVPAEVVCPLICGGGTVYEPIMDYGFPGCVLAVSSIGGLGTAAIKLARLRGLTVWAISSSPSKRDAALAAGAQRFIALDDADAMVKAKGKVDVLLETSPANSSITKYMQCLKINGTYVRVGIPPAKDNQFEFEYIPLIFMQQRICGSVVTGSRRMKEMMQLVSENLDKMLDSEVWKAETVKMSEINVMMDKLINRKNKGYRYVLEW